MRATLLSLALVAFAAFTTRASADWTIIQKTEGAMNSGQVTLRIKADKARLDITNQISVLTDLATGDSTTLNHTARAFLRIPASEAVKMREIALGLKAGAGAETPALTATGRKEKIAEHDCEIYTWKIGEMQVTDWIAKEYPNFEPLMAALARFQNAGLAGAARPLMPPLEQFPGMVIKREMTLRGTKTTTTLVSAKEGPIDARHFEVPKDYRQQPPLQLPAATPAPASPK